MPNNEPICREFGTAITPRQSNFMGRHFEISDCIQALLAKVEQLETENVELTHRIASLRIEYGAY